MNKQMRLRLDGVLGRIPRTLSSIAVGGAQFTPDAAGALYWDEQKTLIVADLHLQKSSSFARRGTLLPPYDTPATLALLAAVIARYGPRRVIALGDSFHDTEGASTLGSDDLDSLRKLQAGRDWLWIAGNHDPHLPSSIGGETVPHLRIGGIRFVHEPDSSRHGPEVAGHLHPAAKLYHRGASVRRKCFIGNGSRLVLPAFGVYAGGLNVLDRAFAALFGRAFLVWMLGGNRVYPIAARQLLAD